MSGEISRSYNGRVSDLIVAGARHEYDAVKARVRPDHRLHRARYVEQPARTQGMNVDVIYVVGTWREKRETVAQLERMHATARLIEVSL